MEQSNKVLLINMPFAPIQYTLLGIHLLKAILERENIGCDVYHANIDYAQMLGVDKYHAMSYALDRGDLAFSKYYNKQEVPYDKFGDKLGVSISLLRDCEVICEEFIDGIIAKFDWDSYEIIGFSSSYSQNLSAFSLAREIKKKYPNKQIVIGGVNCSGDKAEIISKHYPYYDYIFQGEGDNSFLNYCRLVLNKSDLSNVPQIIPGTFFNDDNSSKPVKLDDLPYPIFDDWFSQIKELNGLSERFRNNISIEGSRGCWWYNCTFCGEKTLLPKGSKYSLKKPERILEEIKHISKNYKPNLLMFMDSVINPKYLKPLLSSLSELEDIPPMFCEVKSNITKKELKQLKLAGFTEIQVGIESFQDDILQIINKGSTSLENIQCIRWAVEVGLNIHYNLLFDFPSDNIKHYQEMVKIMELISHLPPPTFVLRVIVKKNSELYKNYKDSQESKFKFEEIHKVVYPNLNEEEVYNFVDNFYFPYTEKSQNTQSLLNHAIKKWKVEWGENKTNSLKTIRFGFILFILDLREVSKQRISILMGIKKQIYLLCDKQQTIASLEDNLRKEKKRIRKKRIRKILKSFCRKNLILEIDEHYLSLANFETDD